MERPMAQSCLKCLKNDVCNGEVMLAIETAIREAVIPENALFSVCNQHDEFTIGELMDNAEEKYALIRIDCKRALYRMENPAAAKEEVLSLPKFLDRTQPEYYISKGLPMPDHLKGSSPRCLKCYQNECICKGGGSSA